MKKKILTLLSLAVLFWSHDMYLKLDTYFLRPNTQTSIHLFNGTFDKSENVIDRDRLIDASLVGNGVRHKVANGQWSEKDSVTILNFKTGEPGTWVAGVSTTARSIELKAGAFNNYLRHDGVVDMLQWREDHDAMDKDAVEKYSKHVKAIFQIGQERSEDWNTNLGYPIEFIPMENPYDKHTGEQLKVQLLLDGKPLADQLVYADYKVTENHHSHSDEGPTHSHEKSGHGHQGETHTHNEKSSHSHAHTDEGHTHSHEKGGHDHEGKTHAHTEKSSHSHDHNKKDRESHTHSHDGEEEHSHEHDEGQNDDHLHTTGQQLRTDSNGIVTLDLSADGIWYLRTIHLVHSEEEGLTHESNWATLTFEVVHDHGHEEHSEDHVHEDDEFPSYIFWIGSLLIIGGLFWWFNKKQEQSDV